MISYSYTGPLYVKRAYGFFFISARYIIRMLSSISRVKLHIKRIAYVAEFRHIDLSADSSVKSSINK